MPSPSSHPTVEAHDADSVVVPLERPGASAAGLIETLGAKAANLVRARAAGLPVVTGLVMPVGAAQAYGDETRPGHARVMEQWLDAVVDLTRRAGAPLVVRSSSPDEDSERSSKAGWYTSVVDVIGRSALDRATGEVIDSAHGGPMAVLAQPLIDARVSGVLFGVDPVTGEDDRLLVAAVVGLPDRLVSGTASATHYRLTHRGRVVGSETPAGPVAPAVLTTRQLRRLARLARRVARLFGVPQDVEWAIDRHERLWLLQSRPITAKAVAPAGPAILGTAGVDETFPDALAPLEVDLWVPPLADGIRTALAITRAVPRRRVDESPVATAVGGRVVADQVLLGTWPVKQHWFDPRPGFRRLTAAWRVGRLRGALVPLATEALSRADRSLRSLPESDRLDDEELLGALDRAGDALRAVHGMEVVMGMLTPSVGPGGPTGLSTASGLLARQGAAPAGHGPSRSDDQRVAEHPVLLALLPPRIGERAPLPVAAGPAVPPDTADGRVSGSGHARTGGVRDRTVALARESLRLRARWLQEAQAVMTGALADRLERDGVLEDQALVRMLHLTELQTAVRTGWLPPDLAERARHWNDHSTPLPEWFRLDEDGAPLAVRRPGQEGAGPGGVGALAGLGAGGGRGSGPVVHEPGEAGPGSVLITATLDPRLAPLVPRLSGLVAETGSPLSHLAIVAREAGVPVVVGVHGARDALPVGVEAVVDGVTGDIRRVDRAADTMRPGPGAPGPASRPGGGMGPAGAVRQEA